MVDNSKIKAKIKHIGAGKFQIEDDKSGGKYIGRVIDASDILRC
jgi:hypothetical protein